MQIKTTVRYHLTPIRMAIIKKSTNKKCWRGCLKRNSCTLWMGMQICAATMVVSQKLKIQLPCDPTFVFLVIYLEITKTLIWKDMCNLMFIAALLNSQDMETLQMLINRCMDKEDVILLRLWLSNIPHRLEYCSAIKRMRFCHFQQGEWT